MALVTNMRYAYTVEYPSHPAIIATFISDDVVFILKMPNLKKVSPLVSWNLVGQVFLFICFDLLELKVMIFSQLDLSNLY